LKTDQSQDIPYFFDGFRYFTNPENYFDGEEAPQFDDNERTVRCILNNDAKIHQGHEPVIFEYNDEYELNRKLRAELQRLKEELSQLKSSVDLKGVLTDARTRGLECQCGYPMQSLLDHQNQHSNGTHWSEYVDSCFEEGAHQECSCRMNRTTNEAFDELLDNLQARFGSRISVQDQDVYGKERTRTYVNYTLSERDRDMLKGLSGQLSLFD